MDVMIWIPGYDFLIHDPQGHVTFAVKVNEEKPGTFLMYLMDNSPAYSNKHYTGMAMVHLLTHDQMEEMIEWFIQQPASH